MGDWRLTVEGVGGHGCGREADDGDIVKRCGHHGCTDCQAIAAVETLKTTNSVKMAKLEHWPVPGAAGTTREDKPGPVDDLLSGKRNGKF